MTEKIMAPWKRELFEKTVVIEESEMMQAGVISGYHEAGVHLAFGKVYTDEEIAQWAVGFVKGYAVRLEVEKQKTGKT